jgi:hypothetical protein
MASCFKEFNQSIHSAPLSQIMLSVGIEDNVLVVGRV